MLRRFGSRTSNHSLSSGGSGYLTPEELPEDATPVPPRSVSFFPFISSQSGFVSARQIPTDAPATTTTAAVVEDQEGYRSSDKEDDFTNKMVVIPVADVSLDDANDDNYVTEQEETPEEPPAKEKRINVPEEDDDGNDEEDEVFEDVYDPFSSQAQDAIDRKRWRPKRRKLDNGLRGQCFRRFPRCYAVFCGVIFPLWFLVFLAWLGGYLLAMFEFEIELDANDEAMRNRRSFARYEQRTGETVNSLPTMCYVLFASNQSATAITAAFETILYEEGNVSAYVDEVVGNFTGQVTIDLYEFGTYLQACGDAADDYNYVMRQSWNTNFSTTEGGPTELSFNWNRCVNTSLWDPQDFNLVITPTWDQVYASRPSNQSLAFAETWSRQQEELEEQYLSAYLEMNYSLFNAQTMAFNNSLNEATGRDSCSKNLAATAWFWFTIMTTVGYGNQSTTSVAGRSLVYVLGFISILFFGGILANTGSIVSHLVGDFFARLRIKFLTYKSVMIFIWGFLWLGWMAGMMVYMYWYEKIRLGAAIPWEDAYWWAFISTTTIGLGDFYPAPALIFTSDLLILTPGFLFGFVLLSTFLSELGQLLAQFSPDMSEELAKRLQYVGILPRFLRCCLNLYGTREISLGHEERDDTTHGAASDQDDRVDTNSGELKKNHSE